MPQRTQISLPAEHHREARKRAAELGISLAEYMRRLVARDLGGPPEQQPRSALFDLGASGAADVASDADRMVGEAVAARRGAFRD